MLPLLFEMHAKSHKHESFLLNSFIGQLCTRPTEGNCRYILLQIKMLLLYYQIVAYSDILKNGSILIGSILNFSVKIGLVCGSKFCIVIIRWYKPCQSQGGEFDVLAYKKSILIIHTIIVWVVVGAMA